MLKNVELLKTMRAAICGVERVRTTTGLCVDGQDRTDPESSKCLIANCYYIGVLQDFDLAYELQYVKGFIKHFGCNEEEAAEVLFGVFSPHTKGQHYADAITDLLKAHGHE